MKQHIASLKQFFQSTLAPFVILAAPFVLLLLSLFYFYHKLNELAEIEEQVAFLGKKQTRIIEQRDREASLLARLQNADHFYLDKYIESQRFLQKEIARLEALAQSSIEEEDKRRLTYLKEGANRLSFVEESLRRNDLMQEVEEKQQHPVEMDEEDLKRLLTLIEGTTIPPYQPLAAGPQLIFKSFDLSKRKLSPQEEVYVINTQIIKRELLKTK